MSFIHTSITGIKDVDLLILQQLEDGEIFNFCLTNKYANYLCKEENFWYTRILTKYPLLISFKKEEETWRRFYLKMAYYINKIQEKWDVPYIPSSRYNPEIVYLEEEELEEMSEDEKDGNNAYDGFILYTGETGDINLVQFLIDKGATTDLSEVASEAAYYNRMPLLNFLLNERDASAESALYGAARASNHSLIEYLISKYNITNIDYGFQGAVKANNMKLMKYFIDKGFKKFNAGLLFAAELGHNEAISFLFSIHNFTTKEKIKGLLKAIEFDRLDSVKLLLNEINDSKILRSSLEKAVKSGSLDVVIYLVNTYSHLDLHKAYQIAKKYKKDKQKDILALLKTKINENFK